ncbi:MAG: Lrp/AsnC ligand binding domain-containing protein [Pseudonocardiaceae bacterium]|nr:Lrp/AsnC ligand binding domain-containing protein [Pseudonocardiaceae bacterium]
MGPVCGGACIADVRADLEIATTGNPYFSRYAPALSQPARPGAPVPDAAARGGAWPARAPGDLRLRRPLRRRARRDRGDGAPLRPVRTQPPRHAGVHLPRTGRRHRLRPEDAGSRHRPGPAVGGRGGGGGERTAGVGARLAGRAGPRVLRVHPPRSARRRPRPLAPGRAPTGAAGGRPVDRPPGPRLRRDRLAGRGRRLIPFRRAGRRLPHRRSPRGPERRAARRGADGARPADRRTVRTRPQGGRPRRRPARVTGGAGSRAAPGRRTPPSGRACHDRGQLDVVQVHSMVAPEMQVPILRRWKAEGKIRMLGVTHHDPLYYPAIEHWIRTGDLDFVQIHYSIQERQVEDRLLRLAEDHGTAVMVNMALEKARLHALVGNRRLPRVAEEIGAATWAQFFLKYVLAHPAVTERVQRLERAGVIAGYRLDIAPAALGLPVTAFARIRPAPGQLPKIAKLAAELPQVTECCRVTGEDCFLVKVHAPAVDQLEEVLDKFLVHGNTTTSIVVSTPVPPRPLPLPQRRDDVRADRQRR